MSDPEKTTSDDVPKKEPGPPVEDSSPANGEKKVAGEPAETSSSSSQEKKTADVPEEKKKREYKDFGHEEEKATRKSLFFRLSSIV